MRQPEPLRAAAPGLLFELFALLLPGMLFLVVYVQMFHAPPLAARHHLALILPLAALLLLSRLGLSAALGHRWGRRIAIGIYASWFLCGLLYYGTVLVGLQSWGRVATWPLVRVYLVHWQDLLDVLEFPALGAVALFSLLVVFASLLATLLTRRATWVTIVLHHLRLRVAIVLTLAVMAVAGLRLYELREATHMGSDEPLMLSLNPWAGTRQGQSNRTEGVRVIDEREARAAAAYEPGERLHKRNVILIVGDALRADRMGVFGHERPTTPYLSSLRQGGQMPLAARAHSVCAESYCGLMALVRSKYLHEFSAHSLSLAQLLKRHGYDTYLLLGGDHTNFYGLADALGPADLYWDGLQSGKYMNDDRAVLARARELPQSGARPVFMQFHLMSAHGLGLRHEEFQSFTPVMNYARRGRVATNPDQLQAWARNFYDNGVLQFDHTLRELLSVLGEKGYLEDAIVVITGDHGELLGERGKYSHADTVLQPVLDIPLLLLRYGYTGATFPNIGFASQVDVAPTVVVELELPLPQSWSGVPLQRASSREFSYFQQAELVGLYDLRREGEIWKFWRDLASGREEAYRLDLDPHEGQDLRPGLDTELRRVWLRKLASSTTSATGNFLPSEITAEAEGTP